MTQNSKKEKVTVRSITERKGEEREESLKLDANIDLKKREDRDQNDVNSNPDTKMDLGPKNQAENKEEESFSQNKIPKEPDYTRDY